MYERPINIGDEILQVGLLGDIVVAADRRGAVLARGLLRQAHEHLQGRSWEHDGLLETRHARGNSTDHSSSTESACQGSPGVGGWEFSRNTVSGLPDYALDALISQRRFLASTPCC